MVQVNLLFDLDSSKITIEQHKISNITKKSLRNTLGLVPQDTIMFNDTFRYNICYAGYTVSDTELSTIIRSVKFDNLNQKMPQGLDTPIGEYGLQLSVS
ncbi:MAG: hypothetical protein HOI53_03160 [Francisellaceae bacterium]|nr:hypothetical protein [Francisellaceae bacterium]MBT6207001.1 hypothetical protein [Francisellaceae bacterium]